MVWQGGLLGRHRLLPHEHPSMQLFQIPHDAMASTVHLTGPKASQRAELCSAVSHISRCIDDLERLQECYQQSEHYKRTAEQAIEYRVSTHSYSNPK